MACDGAPRTMPIAACSAFGLYRKSSLHKLRRDVVGPVNAPFK